MKVSGILPIPLSNLIFSSSISASKKIATFMLLLSSLINIIGFRIIWSIRFYAILLLDEPGLYLHAKSQFDLLQHFEDDFSNRIVYTTHSPFMVPTQNLDSVRTVNIGTAGTTVTNGLSSDSRTYRVRNIK
jgi:predicted ATP-dependent endonuclease of OLD family